MVVGFNHNFNYKGELFHVQTEDSGVNTPHIITLLYKGGTILASKKTSYADIVKVDNLEVVVEELMKEQHKEMLRRLRNGDFDDIILARKDGKDVQPPPVEERSEPSSAPKEEPTPATAKPSPPPRTEAPVEASLDEIILSYLAGEDD